MRIQIAPFIGFDVLHRFLAQDAVFTAPRVSWFGYPIKMLNAMAAGKAVVACESPAYPITHEETRLMVLDNNAHAYAAALQRLIENPDLRVALGVKAQGTILESAARQLESIALAAHDPYKASV